MSKDYYRTLGVARTANDRDIKSAYRKLARQFHPDVNQGDPKAEEKFKEIVEAYNVLSDPESRRRFDQFGTATPRQGRPGPGPAGWEESLRRARGARASSGRPTDASPDITEMFRDLFERRASTQSRVGENLEHELRVTLAEAFAGAMREFTVEVPRQRGGGPIRERIEVRVPPGVRDGQKLRVAGKGYEGADGAPRGDLFFRVVMVPHPTIERRGDDLHTEVEVPVWDALLGGDMEIVTLGGAGTIQIPAETQNGRVFRLAGRGMPIADGRKGDFLARVRVTLPTDLSPRERELIAELRAYRRDS